ncbi:MAG: VTT domain-containing protein [Pyrinomonadaceae bacterium]
MPERPGFMRYMHVLLALFAAAILLFLWYLPWWSELLEQVNQRNIAGLVSRAGMWGPAIVIGLMAVAVVMSPIPSAPIAIAAGATYGHAWGTLMIVSGAQFGAMIAFGLARWLGYDVLRRWLGERLDLGLLGSQNVLMATIFVSRLLPFVSFDIVSYAAGLTRLAPWRFFLATLAGVLPASFLLAHFGGEMSMAGGAELMGWILVGGAITGIPLITVWLRNQRRDAE